MRNDYRYIDRQEDWDAVAEELAGIRQLALDTERNGRHAYQERICLIQLSDGRQTWLLDPLNVSDLSAFGALLADSRIMKVVHGSEEDIRFLHGDFGFTVDNLFDTGLAARFLGVTRPNLGAVLLEFAGVDIPKDRKLQQSHWGLRPLSGPALDYAASDVRYLLPLADELHYRLEQLDRMNWVREECQRLQGLRRPPDEDLDTAFRRVKGWETLSPRHATVLQELYAFRDGKSCFWDMPPTIAASNDDLLKLAQCDGSPPRGIGGLLARRCYGELLEALERGQQNPEVAKPDRGGVRELWTPERRERLKRLKEWRATRGVELGLSINHIWPTPSLERIALCPAALKAELDGGPDGVVRQWQSAEFGEELADLTATMVW